MGDKKEDVRESAELAITLWRESGLSQGAFCRQEGIARTTFQHWRKRYDPSYEHRNKEDSSSARFVRKVKKSKDHFINIEVEEVQAVTNFSDQLEIIYKSDVRIRCSSSVSMSTLQALVNLKVD